MADYLQSGKAESSVDFAARLQEELSSESAKLID